MIQYENIYSRLHQDFMYVFKNSRALTLYFDIIEEFLQSSSQALDRDQDAKDLTTAANWLKTHNRFLQNYIIFVIDISTVRFSTFEIFDSNERKSYHRFDFIVSVDQYDSKIHDENFRFNRLFEKQNMINDDRWYSKNDKDLKTRIFSWLYSYEVEHFRKEENSYFKTAFKNAQYKLNWSVSHFRDDHYWATWMYMRVKKLRIFQNTNKLMIERKKRQMTERLVTTKLIKQSAYEFHTIINENLTITISTQLRIDSTYWIQIEQKINIIMKATCRFHLFLTTTFFEKWFEYVEILANTNNRDIISSNRSWEIVVYYHSRWKTFKTYLLRNSKIFDFEKLKKMMKRMKFQLKKVIHTHALLWIQKFISEMIVEDYIRANVSNKNEKSELHVLVMKHQIHTCRSNMCRKKLINESRCKSEFSQSLSVVTECVDDDQRYTYKRLKEKNRWTSSYNAQMLLIWNAHMNIQYIIETHLAIYVNKYVIKVESNEMYNFFIRNAIKKHLMTRKMNSMKMIMLMLNYEMFRCNRVVMYIDITLSDERFVFVKSLWQLKKNLIEQKVEKNEKSDSFYKNQIEKYFVRSSDSFYDQLTYFDYHAQYNLTKSIANLEREIMNDVKNVVKKKNRYDFLIDDRVTHELTYSTHLDSKHWTTFSRRRSVLLRKTFDDSIMTNKRRDSKTHIKLYHLMLSKSFHDALFRRISRFKLMNNISDD